jgi:hypothetical protein
MDRRREQVLRVVAMNGVIAATPTVFNRNRRLGIWGAGAMDWAWAGTSA